MTGAERRDSGQAAPSAQRAIAEIGPPLVSDSGGGPAGLRPPRLAKETTVLSGSYGRRQRVKSIIGGSAGNLVEWYDWYVYSAFTLYFAPVFFPSDDPTAQLL